MYFTVVNKRVSVLAAYSCVECRLLGLKRMGGSYFSTKEALLCIGCVWALGVILNGPIFLWADVVATGRSQLVCRVPHVDQTVLKIYPAIKNVVVFFLPLVVTWLSYCRIVYASRKSKQTVTTSSSQFSQPRLDTCFHIKLNLCSSVDVCILFCIYVCFMQ